MSLEQFHRQNGARVASDGIPLHYHDALTEYEAALKGAILLDRSHEARLALTGKTCAAFLQRMSTNDVVNLPPSAGRPTIFTNATARIVHRVSVYPHTESGALWLIGGPGRGAALREFLQRQIFFGDDVQITDLSATHAHLALHGKKADALIGDLTGIAPASIPLYGCAPVMIGQAPVFITREKPLEGAHWWVIVAHEHAAHVWQTLTDQGALPAGSLTYNTLRIRAGVPAYGVELSPEYIPLELGLWDEVSFNKGCYTGQEIIARMESRNKLARVLVRLWLNRAVDAPADLRHEGKSIGTVTACTTAPNGEVFAMAIVKTSFLNGTPPDTLLTIGEAGITARVGAVCGVQPAL